MTANGLFLDFFAAFVGPLERELNTRSTHRAGRAHGMADIAAYTARINATNYALSNDDGTGGDYAHADVILVGVSRSGKTPTCLYMALQYGVFAANYPLTEEDLEVGQTSQASRVLPAQAVCPVNQTRTTATNTQRAPSRQPVCLAPAGAIRAAGGRGPVYALRNTMSRHDGMFHRGDREPYFKHLRDRAASAAVKSVTRGLENG